MTSRGSHRRRRSAAVVTSCRQHFCNLLKACKGTGGCCTVSVAPLDAPNLQAILDQAASGGQTVTVCFSAGTYSLVAPLRFSSQHSGFVLEACGGGVTLQADPSSDMTAFSRRSARARAGQRREAQEPHDPRPLRATSAGPGKFEVVEFPRDHLDSVRVVTKHVGNSPVSVHRSPN